MASNTRARLPKSVTITPISTSVVEIQPRKRLGRPSGTPFQRGNRARTRKPTAEAMFSVYNVEAEACFVVRAKSKQEARTQVYKLMTQGKAPWLKTTFANLNKLATKKGCSAYVLLKTEQLVNLNGDNIYQMI